MEEKKEGRMWEASTCVWTVLRKEGIDVEMEAKKIK
jgi:hypothetical protein